MNKFTVEVIMLFSAILEINYELINN